MIIKNCLYCNKEFKVYPSLNRIKYCCKGCYHNSMIGIKYPKSRNNKISKKMIGIPKSINHIKNLSKAAKKRKRKFGKNSSAWKGGITIVNKNIRSCDYYINWRNSCLERDNFTCQLCNKRGGCLNVHHKYPFKKILKDYNIKTYKESKNVKILWDISNGITLCKDCHKKLHKKEGY